MTWAAGLLAKTRNLTVFATIHTAADHPVVVAKQIATLDQIGAGRAGLNIVAGWNRPAPCGQRRRHGLRGEELLVRHGHLLVIGRVRALARDESAPSPLVYWQGQYTTLARTLAGAS